MTNFDSLIGLGLTVAVAGLAFAAISKGVGLFDTLGKGDSFKW